MLADLRSELERNNHLRPGLTWRRLEGGRTNRLWQIGDGAEALVCKVYSPEDGNPMFPNLARDEYAILTGLVGMGLAPDPVAHLALSGVEIVLYRHVAGPNWQSGVDCVAHTLGRLHATRLPVDLRVLPSGSAALMAQIRAILGDCRDSVRDDIQAELSDSFVPPVERPATLHTDVVPGNLIVSPIGLRLIDWQCPARGDPAEDLASFLSPAMQTLYGNQPLPADDVAAFLAAYPERQATMRYRALRPLFHARAAAYCLWKAERGAADYRQAMQLELSALRAG